LRGAAVLAVLLHHLSFYCPVNSAFAERLKNVLYGGWCGVDLFFVLSGFLITGILLDTKHAENYFRAFYARRALRILPAYYAALTILVLAAKGSAVLDAALPLRQNRILYFFYLNNWWALMHGKWSPNILGHFWSLAVEEQFYLFWPLMPWLLPRQKVALVAIAGFVLAPVIRVVLYAHWGAIRDIVENPICRMDTLLMGALLAGIVRSSKDAKRCRQLLPFLALALAGTIAAASSSDSARAELLIFSALALAFGSVVLETFLTRNLSTKLQRILCFPPLRFLGKYSYGMYLYHIPLLWVWVTCVPALKPMQSLPAFILFSCGVTALTIAVAKLSFDYFEIRFLNMKPKFAMAFRT
jgi:peptidoglycan/LPS O-acetylase OafA/YrhL